MSQYHEGNNSQSVGTPRIISFFQEAASLPRLTPHQALIATFQTQSEEIKNLREKGETSSLQFQRALWDFANSAEKLQKNELAQQAYLQILALADPKSDSQRPLYGGAFQRAVQFNLEEQDCRAVSVLRGRYEKNFEDLLLSDQASLSLLFACHDSLLNNQEGVCDCLAQYFAALEHLNQYELREILPWTRDVLRSISAQGDHAQLIVQVITLTVGFFEKDDKYNIIINPDEYYMYKLESIQLFCCSGAHELAYDSLQVLCGSLEIYAAREIAIEQKVRRLAGIFYAQLNHFHEALEQTSSSLEMRGDLSDFFENAEIRIQRVDILNSMCKKAEALAEVQLLTQELHEYLPVETYKAIANHDHQVLLQEYDTWAQKEEGGSFYKLLRIYATISYMEIILSITPDGDEHDRDHFKRNQSEIQFLDNYVEQGSRLRQLTFDEALMVIRDNNKPSTEIIDSVSRALSQTKPGTLMNAQLNMASALLQLQGVREVSEIDRLEVTQCLREADKGIQRQLELKRFINAASLLEMKGLCYLRLEKPEKAYHTYENAFEILDNNGFRYGKLSRNIVQILIEICDSTTKFRERRHYLEVKSDIEQRH